MGLFGKAKREPAPEVSKTAAATGDSLLSRTIRGTKSIVDALAPFTFIGTVKSVNSMFSEAVTDKIKSEATIKAYEVLSTVHRQVTITIIWQNLLLLVSLVPVYFMKSALPFYIAYACAAAHSIRSVYRSRTVIAQWLSTGSLHATLQRSILDVMRNEVAQRPFYERAYMEYLGPDLDRVASAVANKLVPDIKHALVNMALTLGMAFVAFRLFAIPLLEHRALS